LTLLSKAGQPDYKPADRFINRRPVYKQVRLTIGSQHIQDEKTLRDVGIADQQQAGKQGRDDSIKQFNTQLHPIYL